MLNFLITLGSLYPINLGLLNTALEIMQVPRGLILYNLLLDFYIVSLVVIQAYAFAAIKHPSPPYPIHLL